MSDVQEIECCICGTKERCRVADPSIRVTAAVCPECAKAAPSSFKEKFPNKASHEPHKSTGDGA